MITVFIVTYKLNGHDFYSKGEIKLFSSLEKAIAFRNKLIADSTENHSDQDWMTSLESVEGMWNVSIHEKQYE